MDKLRPSSKGGFFHLNGDTLKFFCMAMDDLSQQLEASCQQLVEDGAAEMADEFELLNNTIDGQGANEIFKGLRRNLVKLENGELHWDYTSDNFGEKLYTEVLWQGGTYRITVVLSERDEEYSLKLDVRSWYDPNAQR